MRILHVEDNALNGAFFCDVLRDDGHEVVLVTTGPAGREAATLGTFDLIVLDIGLPGLRGDALCRELRARGLRTPVVALTASAMPDEMIAIGSAGFDECMTKPVAPEDLRLLARRYDPARRAASVAVGGSGVVTS